MLSLDKQQKQLMSTHLVCVIVLLGILSQKPNETTVPPRSQKPIDSKGSEAAKSEPQPPEPEPGLQLFLKDLLTDAISKSLNDAIKELFQKLKVTDEVCWKQMGLRWTVTE